MLMTGKENGGRLPFPSNEFLSEEEREFYKRLLQKKHEVEKYLYMYLDVLESVLEGLTEFEAILFGIYQLREACKNAIVFLDTLEDKFLYDLITTNPNHKSIERLEIQLNKINKMIDDRLEMIRDAFVETRRPLLIIAVINELLGEAEQIYRH